MKHITTGFLAAIAAIAILTPSGAKDDGSDLVVHEWGTFLTMNGSDGITLDGMYHEEHALPPFVHSRSNEIRSARAAPLKSASSADTMAAAEAAGNSHSTRRPIAGRCA